MADIKYPHIRVKLIGTDGNAMAVISRARLALRSAGVPDPTIREYTHEAMEGGYNNVLQTTMRWVNVE